MVWARCVGRTSPNYHAIWRNNGTHIILELIIPFEGPNLPARRIRRWCGGRAGDDQVQRVQTRSGMEARRGSGPIQIPARAIVLDGYLAVSLTFRHCPRHGVSNTLKHQLLCSAVRLGRSNPPKLQMLTRRLREGSSQAIGQPDGDNTGDDRRQARVVREYERI